MTSKYIEVRIFDPFFEPKTVEKYGSLVHEHPRLFESECPNIMKKFEDKEITDDDVTNALDVLIAHMTRRGVYKYVVNIGERDNSLRPLKEMTLEEIEEQLNCRIKIVNKEEKK